MNENFIKMLDQRSTGFLNREIQRRGKTQYDRFIEKINITDSLDDCWNWIGHKNYKNYGCLKIKNKTYRAHRVAYMEWIGEIPDEKPCICHKCDNPSCVNPFHLWAGTHQDNRQDCVNKNRHSSGENRPNAKLTNDDVRLIKKLKSNGKSNKEIYELFPQVTDGTIISIINGKHRKNE